MASAVTTQRFFSRNKQRSYAHVPGGTSASVLTPDSGTTRRWFDMANFGGIAFTVGTVVSGSNSGPTLVELVCADDTSGTNTTVVVSSGTVASTHIDDSISVECMAQQIREVSSTARYASVRITTSNSGDKMSVCVTQNNPVHPQSSLTANSIQ